MIDAIKLLSAEERRHLRTVATDLLREVGVENPEALAEMAQTTAIAERDGDVATIDPVTGRQLDALELMDQLEAEGKDRMGVEFSRRRGYTETEIEQFEDFVRAVHAATAAGAAEDDVCFALGVATGQLDPPTR